GRYLIDASIYAHYDVENRIKAYHMIRDIVTKQMVKEIDLPILAETEDIMIDYLNATPEIQREEKPKKRFVKIEAMTGLEEHISIVHGRMFSTEKQDGIFEAIVTEEAMQKLDLRLDEVYQVLDFTNQMDEPLRVK